MQDPKPHVFEYLDYRQFLRDHIAHLKAQKKYSARSFARKAGFKNSNFINLIIKGERNLTRASLKKLAQAFEFKTSEVSYLERLLQFSRAKTAEEQNGILQDLFKSSRKSELREVAEAQYEYFSNWVILAAFVALSSDWKYKSIKEQAEDFGISPRDMEKGFETLEKLKLIKKRAGVFHPTNETIKTPREMQSVSVQNYHQQMIQKAVESMKERKRHERHFGSLSVTLSQEEYQEATARLFEFKEEMLASFGQSNSPDRVYQLNFQLFPLVDLNLPDKK
jgi:uncharacterized protein (TIGR02147 family)